MKFALIDATVSSQRPSRSIEIERLTIDGLKMGTRRLVRKKS
jgi:hypothetical protein